VPHKGIGYGILKYLTAGERKPGMTFGLHPQVSFNYHGQFDMDVDKKSFRIAAESPGNSISMENQRDYELDVIGMIADKRLVMSVFYSKKQFKDETIKPLLDNYKNYLKRIIYFCSNQAERELTPSDCTYSEVSIDYLDKLKKQYPIEDIYRLSPMQEGMFFHSLYDESSTAYFTQVLFRLKGELVVSKIKDSLNESMNRYDILRTIFILQGLSYPLQVVLKERQMKFSYIDLRKMSPGEERDRYIREFKISDKKSSFNLHNDVLMRAAVLQLEDTEFVLAWSFHHILMDGWSIGLIISEFFEIYKSFISGKPHHLPETVQYKEYIKWLQNQDMEVTSAYWENYLEGYKETAILPKRGSTGKRIMGYERDEVSMTWDNEKTRRLREISGRNNVTLNTILHSIWGILLGRYAGKQDVVFGSVVSGRPSELRGIESMIGLFINTVPVRIRIRGEMSFKELLQGVQKAAVESEKHHHFPLAEIQALSPLKKDLIDHIIDFANYPIEEQLDNLNDPGVELSVLESFEQSNYDFNIFIRSSGKHLKIQFEFNCHVYEQELVKRIAGHFDTIIEQITADDEVKIEDIKFALPFTASKSNILREERHDDWVL
jgi:iturin family lipopeptide synthetase B